MLISAVMVTAISTATAEAAGQTGRREPAVLAGQLRTLTISGPVTLEFSAKTSDGDSCTGKCDEGPIGPADFSAYSRDAHGTVNGQVNFAVDDGKTTPGTGPLTESSAGFTASSTFTMQICQCGPLAGSATENLQGGTSPGTMTVTSLAVTKNKAGQPDLALGYSMTAPLENTLVKETTTPFQIAPFTWDEIIAYDDIYFVNQSLGVNPMMTGWTINPGWTPAKGGTLATRTVNATAPQPPSEPGAADNGSQAANETWTLVTKPARLEITSPPDGATIALTDPKYVMPQAGPAERAPKNRTLKVEGTAHCPGPVDINGMSVPVTGDHWSADLPVKTLGLGALTLTAKAKNCGEASNSLTLINLVITSPDENASLPITAAPAMPDLNATIDVQGYPGDLSNVSFDWTLKVNGKTVSRPGRWTDYSRIAATGTTRGPGEAWHPKYANTVGGIGRLVVTASLPDVPDLVTSDPRWINVPGTNPGAAVAKRFVSDHERQFADTYRHIVCIESDWRQFNPRTDNRETAIGGVPSDWKPNPGRRQPLYGPPAGIGIAQLDPAGLTGPDQYWDWKQNLLGGIAVFRDKMRQARQWAGHEQARLDHRLAGALHQANRNRKAQGLPPLHMSAIRVPALTNEQVKLQTIRLYNGGNEFHFNADYVLAGDNINVTRTGNGRWVKGPAGFWGHPSKNLHQALRWIALPKRFQGYVTTVLNCKNS